jgi:hypothetical protein
MKGSKDTLQCCDKCIGNYCEENGCLIKDTEKVMPLLMRDWNEFIRSIPKWKYTIGARYIHSKDLEKRVFKLKEVGGRHRVFRFECGHWCTDSAFGDYINIEIGVQQVLDF